MDSKGDEAVRKLLGSVATSGTLLSRRDGALYHYIATWMRASQRVYWSASVHSGQEPNAVVAHLDGEFDAHAASDAGLEQSVRHAVHVAIEKKA